MKLLIRSPCLSEDITLDLRETPAPTVYDVKRAIKAASKLSPSVSHQQLLFAGRPLNNDDDEIEPILNADTEEGSDNGVTRASLHVVHLVLKSGYYERQQRKQRASKGTEGKPTEKGKAPSLTEAPDDFVDTNRSSTLPSDDQPEAFLEPEEVSRHVEEGRTTVPPLPSLPQVDFTASSLPYNMPTESADAWSQEQLEAYHRQYAAYLQHYQQYYMVQQLAYVQAIAAHHQSRMDPLQRRPQTLGVQGRYQTSLLRSRNVRRHSQGDVPDPHDSGEREPEPASAHEPEVPQTPAAPVINEPRARMRLIVLPLHRLLSIFSTSLKLLFFVYIFTRHADWYRATFMYAVAIIIFLGEVGALQMFRRRRRRVAMQPANPAPQQQPQQPVQNEVREQTPETETPVSRNSNDNTSVSTNNTSTAGTQDSDAPTSSNDTTIQQASASGTAQQPAASPAPGGLLPEVQAVFTSFFISLIPSVSREDLAANPVAGEAVPEGVMADRG